MRFFKAKVFCQFAEKKDIEDKDLIKAVREVESGLIDANLGGGVYKKRIARKGQGKSSGFRVIICFRHEQMAFFAHGFAKSSLDNITDEELADFKDLAKMLFKMTEAQIQKGLESGEFQEVKEKGQ